MSQNDVIEALALMPVSVICMFLTFRWLVRWTDGEDDA